MPVQGSRAPIQLTPVPLKLRVAWPPAVRDTATDPVPVFGEAPLQSLSKLLCRQSDVYVTEASASSMRALVSMASTTMVLPVAAALAVPVTLIVNVWRPGARVVAMNTVPSISAGCFVATVAGHGA